MNINNRTLVSCLFLLPAAIFANKSEIQNIPAFKGGLNMAKIKSCENQYQKLCAIDKTKSGIEATARQWACIEKKMAKNKSCAQANEIRKIHFSPATEFRKYGPVTVFYTTALADGIDQYFMVDTTGKLIGLTTQLNLSSNTIYQKLKKNYPDMGQTSFLYWTKNNEDLFPKSQVLSNKNQQLVFRQELRSPTCVACAKVGILDVAYEFNPKGAYLRPKLLKITPLDKKP